MCVHYHWSTTCIKYEHVNDGDILCICMTPLCIHLIYVPSLVGGFSFFGTVDCVWTQILYYAWIQTVHEILIGLSSLKLNGDVDGSVTRIFLRILRFLIPPLRKMNTSKPNFLWNSVDGKQLWQGGCSARYITCILTVTPQDHLWWIFGLLWGPFSNLVQISWFFWFWWVHVLRGTHPFLGSER